MGAGKYRHRVTIQTFTEARNGFGEVVRTWGVYKVKWALVTPMNGNERVYAEQIMAGMTHTIDVPYISGITPGMRVTWNGRTFNIESVTNSGERNISLVLICSEIINAGV